MAAPKVDAPKVDAPKVARPSTPVPSNPPTTGGPSRFGSQPRIGAPATGGQPGTPKVGAPKVEAPVATDRPKLPDPPSGGLKPSRPLFPPADVAPRGDRRPSETAQPDRRPTPDLKLPRPDVVEKPKGELPPSLRPGEGSGRFGSGVRTTPPGQVGRDDGPGRGGPSDRNDRPGGNDRPGSGDRPQFAGPDGNRGPDRGDGDRGDRGDRDDRGDRGDRSRYVAGTRPQERISAPWETGSRDRSSVRPSDRHKFRFDDDDRANEWARRFAGQQFGDRYHRGGYDTLLASRVSQQYNLGRQFELYAGGGDVARRLAFSQQLAGWGGWSRRPVGITSRAYLSNCFTMQYPGPSYYPRTAWYPRWGGWINWSWGWRCLPIFDPRPIICRPYVYDDCRPWNYYAAPAWRPLPIVASGTWVDVQPTIVPQGADLELLAVRFIDPGHPDEQIGPRYRVWFRNNGPDNIDRPFDVNVMADLDQQWQPDMPYSGVRVASVAAGETKAIDVRLPYEVNTMARAEDGVRAPFTVLHVVVDANREVAEFSEDNNGQSLNRGDVLPVDPASFAVDVPNAVTGQVVTIAGEGFGPEPGQVFFTVGGRQIQAEIQGWYDLGVQVKLPENIGNEVIDTELVVLRGDGAAANPVAIQITPAGMAAAERPQVAPPAGNVPPEQQEYEF